MNLAILGSFAKRPLGPGWRKETAVAFPGGENWQPWPCSVGSR
jgi:hypothetical protein